MPSHIQRRRPALAKTVGGSLHKVRSGFRNLRLESLESRLVLSGAPMLWVAATQVVQVGTAVEPLGSQFSISGPNFDFLAQESIVVQVTSGSLSFPLHEGSLIGDAPFGASGITSITNADGSYLICDSNGLVAAQGTGTPTGYVAITGTADGINTLAHYLEYSPPKVLTGSTAVMSVLAMNADGSPPQSISQSMTINITPQAIPPIIDGPASQNVTPGSTLTFSQANRNAITVTDPGNQGEMESVQIQANGTLTPGPNTAGVTVLSGPSYPSGLGLYGSIAAINSAMDGLQFTPTTDSGPVLLKVTINDNDGQIAFLSTQINVSSTPTTPVLDFGVGSSSTAEQCAATGGAGLTFSAANGNAILVQGANSTVNSLTAFLQTLSGTLTITNVPGDVTVAGNGNSLMSVTGTPAEIDAALDGLNYQPNDGIASDILEGFVLNSGDDAATLSAWIPIAIDPTGNASPSVIAIPGTQSVQAGSMLEFSQAAGNALRVADGDANGSIETVFVQVLSGTLAVGNTAGLTSVSGNGTNLIALSGTVSNLNAALDGLRYLFAPATESSSDGSAIETDYLSVMVYDPSSTVIIAPTGVPINIS